MDVPVRSATKLASIVAIAALAYFAGVQTGFIPGQQGTSAGATDQVLAAAFEDRRSDVQVRGGGHISRLLPDDNKGSRHQRFIVRLASGQTLLIAHNIDLANRIDPLQTGDYVEFNGEYEWTAQGGVIHWTHRDPRGSHVDGWIKHSGKTYQ
jgi:hypothetical protein